ncbi:MAG: 30S ribosomal protein S3 [bacterium]
MGQKVNPVGFRIGGIRSWNSRWYAKNNYANLLHEDLSIREYIKKRLKHTGVSKVEIERATNKIKVNVHASRPGIIIGKKGLEIEKLKTELQRFTDKQIFLNILEIRKAELDAKLVADNICMQLERRISYRKAMKKAVASALRFGAIGVKVCCAGRLGGAEMARTVWYREGRVPLHTLRADVDYGLTEARTTYGIIGVKVWIFKGEILASKKTNATVEMTI